jgi:hypothetical protein
MKKSVLIVVINLMWICCYGQRYYSKYLQNYTHLNIEEKVYREYFTFRAGYNKLVNPDSLRKYIGERGQYSYKNDPFIFDLKPYMKPESADVLLDYNLIPFGITNYPDSLVKTGYYLIHKPKNIFFNTIDKYFFNVPFFYDSLYKFDDYILVHCEELDNYQFNIKMISGNLVLDKKPYPMKGAKESLLKYFDEEFLQVRLRGVRFGLHKGSKILGGRVFKDSLDNFEKKRIAYTADHALIKTDSLVSKIKSGLLFFTYDTLSNKSDLGYNKMDAFFISSDKQFTNDENVNNIYMVKYKLIYPMQYDKIEHFPIRSYDDVKPLKVLIAKNLKEYQNFIKKYFVFENISKDEKVTKQNFLEFNAIELYKCLEKKGNYLKDQGVSFLVGKSVYKK